jgi:hypothetical protein
MPVLESHIWGCRLLVGPDPGSLVARTDSPDGDNAMFDSAANTVVIGGPTQLLPAGKSLIHQLSGVIN